MIINKYDLHLERVNSYLLSERIRTDVYYKGARLTSFWRNVEREDTYKAVLYLLVSTKRNYTIYTNIFI